MAALTTSLSALPLEDVTLYTSGVGEFVHRGKVTGSGTLVVNVPADSMSDVLRSLILIDHDGGTVEAVNFATGEDIATRLGRFPVDLAATQRLHHVLRQLRGSAVEITVRVHGDSANREFSTVTGILVGAEENTVLVAGEKGLREIPSGQIESVDFSDPQSRAEFSAALEALSATTLASDQRELEVRYTGSATRRLEIRYLQETPRWHTTYRAVLESGSDRAHLQGWVHLDNTTAIDWNGVRLTLVSASPITYSYNLYEPQYVVRPPFVQDDALDPSAPTVRSAPAVRPEAMMLRSTVTPTMDAEELFTGMTFTIPESVTVLRGRSTMVPLVNRPHSVTATRYYDPRRDGDRPRAAFRLTNDGVEQLPGGPITVYEGIRYVGDGAIPTLLPGAETIVTYARDMDLRVTTSADTGDEELITMRIVDGLLVAEHRTRHTTTYQIRSSTGVLPGSGGTPPLQISHPLRSGWELVSPRGADRQGQVAIVTARGTGETVVEERVRSHRYALTNLDDEMLVSFSTNRLIDPTVRRTLQNISTLRSTLADLRRTRRDLENRRDTLFADQERISANMAQLDRNSTLYRRYVSDLARQEDELRIIREDLEDALREERQAEAALREYLRTLGVD